MAKNITSVRISRTTLDLKVDKSEQLGKTICPINASNQSVTWSSNNPDVATVTSSGYVTARRAGTAKITVKTNDGGYIDTCTVTVSIVPVTGIQINSSFPMKGNDTKRLTATVYPNEATYKTVTWHTSNPNAVTMSGGLACSKSSGQAIITAKSTDGSNVTSNGCTITISVPVTKIELVKSLTLKLNESKLLTPCVYPINATNKSVAWHSSNSNVAKVSGGGLICVKGYGETTITAKSTDGSYVTSTSCVVKVPKTVTVCESSPKTTTKTSSTTTNKTPANQITDQQIPNSPLGGSSEVKFVNVTPSSILIYEKKNEKLKVDETNVKWLNSNPTVANVENNIVYAYKEGKTVLTAVSQNPKVIKYPSNVTVIVLRPFPKRQGRTISQADIRDSLFSEKYSITKKIPNNTNVIISASTKIGNTVWYLLAEPVQTTSGGKMIGFVNGNHIDPGVEGEGIDTNVQLSPNPLVVIKGKTGILTSKNITYPTWSSSDINIASIKNISSKQAAIAGVKEGITTITANSTIARVIVVTEKTETAIIKQSNVNLRSGPNLADGYTTYFTLQKDNMVRIQGSFGNWYYVIARGKQGFVRNDLVEILEKPTPPVQYSLVTQKELDEIIETDQKRYSYEIYGTGVVYHNGEPYDIYLPDNPKYSSNGWETISTIPQKITKFDPSGFANLEFESSANFIAVQPEPLYGPVMYGKVTTLNTPGNSLETANNCLGLLSGVLTAIGKSTTSVEIIFTFQKSIVNNERRVIISAGSDKVKTMFYEYAGYTLSALDMNANTLYGAQLAGSIKKYFKAHYNDDIGLFTDVDLQLTCDIKHKDDNGIASYLWVNTYGEIMERPIIYPNDKLKIGTRTYYVISYGDFKPLYDIDISYSFPADKTYQELFKRHKG